MVRRILVIDDHSAVHRGVEAILSESLENLEFTHAYNAQQALEQLRNGRWDLAVLDLSLPGQGGLELIRMLKDEQPNLGILVYTMHSEEHFGARAVRAGANGYLTKDSPAGELPKAVVEILRGRRYIGPTTAAAVSRSLGGTMAEAHERLSDREYEILQRIGRGMRPTEIARDLSLSVKTVSTYRTRLLEKLNLRTTAELVRYAVDHRIVE